MKYLLAIDFLCFAHLTFTSFTTSDGMMASGLMLRGV